MKKNAFTLAEVLITLVIIGVIAAMTIPTLMGSTNNQEMRSRYKKALAALNQAASLEYALYGNECCKGFDCNNDHTIFANMLKNHMSVIDSCVNDDCTIFKTSDGMIYNVDQCYVNIDLNGDKGPNQWGQDVFGAWISLMGDTNNTHTFIPDGAESQELLNN